MLCSEKDSRHTGQPKRNGICWKNGRIKGVRKQIFDLRGISQVASGRSPVTSGSVRRRARTFVAKNSWSRIRQCYVLRHKKSFSKCLQTGAMWMRRQWREVDFLEAHGGNAKFDSTLYITERDDFGLYKTLYGLHPSIVNSLSKSIKWCSQSWLN